METSSAGSFPAKYISIKTPTAAIAIIANKFLTQMPSVHARRFVLGFLFFVRAM